MKWRGLVLDANLLVLLIVGLTEQRLIGRHKRLDSFSPEDFTLLTHVLSLAERVIVTPHTLTEASNLVAYIAEPARTRIREAFRVFVSRTEEVTVESKMAVGAPEFVRLGLADAALLEITRGTHTLLTTDHDLYQSALKRGASAVNFNHLREQAGTV